MDLPNPASEEPTVSGAWTRRRRATLGLTAVALVAGGGVAIAAGQPSTDGTDNAPATTAAKPVPDKAAFGLGGVLHSESVVSDGNGGYLTHLMQMGKVESVDADNLTVVSEDGFKQSWKRTPDTVVGGANWSVTKNDDGSWTVRKATEDLGAGQQVTVVGTKADGAATAQRIAAAPEGGGEIPGMILKGLQGGDDGMGSAPGLKQRLQERLQGRGGTTTMPAPMGGPDGTVRKFEFRTGPDGEGKTTVVPAPGQDYGYSGAVPAPAAPEAPSTSTVPAEPSAAYSSGSVSFT